MEAYSTTNNLHRHKIIIINENAITCRDDDIYSFQRYMYTERVSSSDRLKNALGALSGDTLDYYNQMVEVKKAENDSQSSDDFSEATDALQDSFSLNALIKYGVIGILAEL